MERVEELRDVSENLADQYIRDPKPVIEILRKRMNEGEIILAESMETYRMKKHDIKPLIQMIEEELDKGNPITNEFGVFYLKDLYNEEELVEWCTRWRGDSRKEKVIFRSLGQILCEMTRERNEHLKQKIVDMVKEFASKKDVDYDEEVRLANIGGKDNFKEILGAQAVLQIMLEPREKLDVEVLKRNIDRYPAIKEVFKEKWLIKDAASKRYHIITYIYSKEEKYAEATQKHWNDIFQRIIDKNILGKREKLLNTANDRAILSEYEVLFHLIPYFNIVQKEPKLGTKHLEYEIEYNGEKALVEVRTMLEPTEMKYSFGATIGFPGGKMKGKIMDKIQDQFSNGEIDPKEPLILIISAYPLQLPYEEENAIFGEMQIGISFDTGTGKGNNTFLTRANNSIFNEPGSEIISAIVSYSKLGTDRETSQGRIYLASPKKTKNPASKEFIDRMDTALFGEKKILTFHDAPNAISAYSDAAHTDMSPFIR